VNGKDFRPIAFTDCLSGDHTADPEVIEIECRGEGQRFSHFDATAVRYSSFGAASREGI